MKLKDIVVLVDMDNVIANWDVGMANGLLKQFPKMKAIPLKDRKIRNIYTQYEKKYGKDIVPWMFHIHRQPKFYRNLEPMPNAIEALKRMAKVYKVIICGNIPRGAPKEELNRITNEKLEWIEYYLGSHFAMGSIFIEASKATVDGNYLIDDSPNQGNGSEKWEQILFDWPYNKNEKKYTRISWDNWESVLNEKIRVDIEKGKFEGNKLIN